MGLLLSVVISYAGVNEAVECLKHILSGVVPDDHCDFQELADYYSSLLRKANNSSSAADWSKECGQGYLYLTEDKNGKLKSAAVKYYGDNTNSTAILFSTKISSFGQESLEESQSNGDSRSDRYTPTKTKTILTNSSGSISVGQRNRSPTPRETISDSNHNSFTSNSVEFDNKEDGGADEKLTWHYRPLSPARTPQSPPEIHFQSFDEDKRGVYTEEFLRSRSRENSRERRSDHWSVEGSVDSVASEDNGELKPMLKDVPKLNSFEEETTETKEVIEEEEEDFWGSGD